MSRDHKDYITAAQRVCWPQDARLDIEAGKGGKHAPRVLRLMACLISQAGVIVDLERELDDARAELQYEKEKFLTY